MENDVDPRGHPGYYTDKSYALSGKIMLSAIIILFFVVIFMVFLHLYARWYLLRARRRHVHRNRHRRTHFVFYVDPANTNPIRNSPSCGLDASVLKSLPVFIFSSKNHPDGLDCAVCLSEFEEHESGRILPKCNHSFHIGCIDMWFHTHDTCPLCRSPVELVSVQPENVTVQSQNPPTEIMVSVTEQGTSAGENESSGGRDPEASRILTHSSSFMLSFKRMLSRDKRGNGSECGGGGSVNDSDIERGREEIQR